MHRLIGIALSCAICASPAFAQTAPKGQPVAATTVDQVVPAPKPSVPAPATLIVKIPASATLKVDGKVTGHAVERTIMTTPLPPGQSHEFKLEAEMMSHGQKVKVAMAVTVNAGEKLEMPFDVPGAAGESDAKTK